MYRLFTEATRKYLIKFAKSDLEIEGNGDTLLIHKNALIKPLDAQKLLQESLDIFNLMRRDSPARV